MASFRAHLSPNEETTLRRIAGGTTSPDELGEADTRRLIALGLVMQIDGELTATEVGMARCASEITTPTLGRRRRLKPRQLPF
jgi:hypothetical protein